MSILTKEFKTSKDFGLLLLRVVAAFALLYGHGWGKLEVIFGPQEINFFDPIGIGANFSFILVGFAEGICTILLLVGLFSRFAALTLVINFAVILLVVHFGHEFKSIETSLLYVVAFAVLLFAGPGKYSLDRLLLKKKY